MMAAEDETMEETLHFEAAWSADMPWNPLRMLRRWRRSEPAVKSTNHDGPSLDDDDAHGAARARSWPPLRLAEQRQ